MSKKLIYSPITSLDGYIEDERGKFNWAVPDAEVHSFVNDLIRPIGTFLYGRRMYETMLAWETFTEGEPFLRDFARIWRAAEKVVFSGTLRSASSARTRIERTYHVQVGAIGYQTWARHGVRLRADRCHVVPVSLTAKMQRSR